MVRFKKTYNFVIMRFINIVLVLLMGCFSTLKAQEIFPYLEVKNNMDFNNIKSDSIQIQSHYNHFLNDVQITYYYTNTSTKTIDTRFIVPQYATQNIYHLSTFYNNQLVQLQAQPIASVRQEIKALKSKSGYDNQSIVKNTILNINHINPGEKFRIVLKFSKIISANGVKYGVNFPEKITIRTEEFTSTAKNDLKAFPTSAHSVHIFTGSIPLEEISLNQKTPRIKKISSTHWQVEDEELKKINFQYHYEAKNISSSIQQFSDKGCDYILGVIQPPKDIKQIAPREYIFVIDASGSMKGRPIEEVKKMMTDVLKQLKPDEAFNIVVYGTNQDHFAKSSVLATTENIEAAIAYLAKEYGKGAVKLNEAIEAIQHYKLNPAYNRIITIVSDGDININENVHLAIKSHAKTAQFFILGIGNNVDYRAMNFLSLSTGTQPIVITNEYELGYKIKQFKNLILKPLLRNVQVQSKSIDLTETYPKNFNGFLATEPIHFVAKDCKKTYPKRLEITAKNGTENYNKDFEIKSPYLSNLTEAIRFYWVKQKIEFLLKDEDRCGELCIKDGRYRKEIEKLGIEYNLSTPYTLLIQNNDSSIFNQDYDSDGDGISDWYDECVYEKGPLITKGCPIEKLNSDGHAIYVQDLSNEWIRAIEFDFDQTIIRSVDFGTLDRIVKLMQTNPQLQFSIEGHTDARGTESYNQNLSTARAQAVLKYFTDKGLNPTRFKVIGKGFHELKHAECRPAEQCEEWKNLQNRRVEFKLIP